MKRFIVMIVLVVALVAGNVHAEESGMVDEMRSMTTTELRYAANRILGTLALVKADLAETIAKFNLFIMTVHQVKKHGGSLPEGETLRSTLGYIDELRARMDKLEGDVESLKFLYQKALDILDERRSM